MSPALRSRPWPAWLSLALTLLVVSSSVQAHGPRGGYYRHGWGDSWLVPLVVGTAMVGTAAYFSRPYPVPVTSSVVITSPPVVVVETPPPVYGVSTWSGAAVAAPATEAYYCRESGQYYPYVQNCASPWLVVSAPR